MDTFGREAEEFVAQELVRRGWKILERNCRHIGYELDIVATKGATVAIVEVKARYRMPNGAAELAALLSPRKQAALRRGAQAMAKHLDHDRKHLRIDLAFVFCRNERYQMQYFWDVVRDD